MRRKPSAEDHKSMPRWPSGQREQTFNLLCVSTIAGSNPARGTNVNYR